MHAAVGVRIQPMTISAALMANVELIRRPTAMVSSGLDPFARTDSMEDRPDSAEPTRSEGRSPAEPRACRTCAGPVVVAIPAHDEEAAIAEVVSEAAAYADHVIVIDDGSNDDTADRAREAGAVVIEHAYNRGYGATLRTAFRAGRARGAAHLLTLDGDGQHDPADIPRLVAEQHRANAEIVIASRFVEGYPNAIPAYRRLGLRAIGLLTNVALSAERSGSWISDTQCGFRAYDEHAIDSLATDDTIGSSMGASVEILDHARRHEYMIAEIGTTVSYDVENANNENPITHGIDVLRSVLKSLC